MSKQRYNWSWESKLKLSREENCGRFGNKTSSMVTSMYPFLKGTQFITQVSTKSIWRDWMLTWVTRLICLLTGGKPAYDGRYIYTEAYWWRKNATIQNSDNTLADLIGMCYLFFFCRRKRASSHAGLRSTLFLWCLQDTRELAMWRHSCKGMTGQG